MTTWFSSDHHFGHRNIIEYCKRPYRDMDEMNEDLIQRHNAVVAPDDTFICVGDLSLGWDGVELSQRLNGIKILVPGNHDKCWPTLTSPKRKRAAERATERYEEMGWSVTSQIFPLMSPSGYLYQVSHLPYDQDERHGDRYVEYYPEKVNAPLICGHVHDLWHTKDNQFNVGVDVNDYSPVAFETIDQWLTERIRSAKPPNEDRTPQ